MECPLERRQSQYRFFGPGGWRHGKRNVGTNLSIVLAASSPRKFGKSSLTVNCDHRLLAARPSPLTTVGCKVLVREGAIQKWFNNFNLGKTNAYMASITSGSEFTVIRADSGHVEAYPACRK